VGFGKSGECSFEGLIKFFDIFFHFDSGFFLESFPFLFLGLFLLFPLLSFFFELFGSLFGLLFWDDLGLLF
jgi:hypothetical protein